MNNLEIQYFAEEQIIYVLVNEEIVKEIKIKDEIDNNVRFTLFKNKIFKGFSSSALYDLINL